MSVWIPEKIVKALNGKGYNEITCVSDKENNTTWYVNGVEV